VGLVRKSFEDVAHGIPPATVVVPDTLFVGRDAARFPIAEELRALLDKIKDDAEFLVALGVRILIGHDYFSVQMNEVSIVSVKQFGAGFEVENTFSFRGPVAESLSVDRLRGNYRNDLESGAQKVGQLLGAYSRLVADRAERN
jgi:hypothetical protein